MSYEIENETCHETGEIKRLMDYARMKLGIAEDLTVEVRIKKGVESFIRPRITLAIPDRFPKSLIYAHASSHVLENWKEWVVENFAHELIHLRQIMESKSNEEEAETTASKIVEEFRNSPVMKDRESVDRYW